jgi:hypothetical protein
MRKGEPMKWAIYRIGGETTLWLAYWFGHKTRLESVERALLAAADWFFIPLYLAGKIQPEDSEQ